MDNVAGIHQAQPNASGNGRGNVAVNDLHLGSIHLALVKLHRAFVLMDGGHLGSELLFGNRVAAVSNLVTFQINMRILQQGFVAL